MIITRSPLRVSLGGGGTDVQFELVAKQPEVVTETPQPQQQGGKGTSGDTVHTRYGYSG